MSLSERVARRLDELHKSPYQASLDGGFEKNYFADLITGRKKNVRRAHLPRIAAVLKTSVAFLEGTTAEPTLQNGVDRKTLKIIGTVDAGAYRADEMPELPPCDVCPDSRFPSSQQAIYRVADAPGLERGDMLCVVDADDYAVAAGPIPAGSLVVCRETGGRGTRRISVRRVEYAAGRLTLGCAQSGSCQIVGVVRRIVRPV